jgi:hypothetical protein
VTTLQLVAFQLVAGGEAKKSGPIGFAVILVLCVVCYFLFKSMSKHLRKVREDFPSDEAEVPPAAPPTSDGPGAPTAPPVDAGDSVRPKDDTANA